MHWLNKLVWVLVYSMSLKVVDAVDFYGPYDYTNPIHVQEKLPIVEQYHFFAEIESLDDREVPMLNISNHLWYVIRSFPNHHRALNSMARLWRRYSQKNQIPPGIKPHLNPDYLFERAINFAPHDGAVRLLYGMHLHTNGNHDKALKQYEKAAEISPNSAETHYNLGLLYLTLKNNDKAKFHALKAYDLGYPLPGLRNKMIAAGLWTKNKAP